MTTATEKFTEGQRVKMTEKAIAAGLHGHKANRRTGVVKGFPQSTPVGDPSMLVYVRRDGERSKRCYHMDFWEPEEAGKQ